MATLLYDGFDKVKGGGQSETMIDYTSLLVC